MTTMGRPTAQILSNSQLQEHLLAHSISPHIHTDQHMRELVDGTLKKLWTGDLTVWLLPELHPQAMAYESHLCMQHWRQIITSRLNGVRVIEPAEEMEQRAFWPLLLVRLDRLRNIPPTTLHQDAWDGLLRLLTRTYKFPYPESRDRVNLRPPIELPLLSTPLKKSMTLGTPKATAEPVDASDDEDILELQASPEDVQFTLPSSGTSPPTRPRTCFRCKRGGHVGKDCDLPRRTKDKRKFKSAGYSAPYRDANCRPLHSETVGGMKATARISQITGANEGEGRASNDESQSSYCRAARRTSEWLRRPRHARRREDSGK